MTMSILNLFKPKLQNPFLELEKLVVKESESILTKKELKNFSLSAEYHNGYLFAELVYAIETEPRYKDFVISEELQIVINGIKMTEPFKLFFSDLLNCSNGIPSRIKALNKLTSDYFLYVWNAPDEDVKNNLSLRIYSIYLAKIRAATLRLVEKFLTN